MLKRKLIAALTAAFMTLTAIAAPLPHLTFSDPITAHADVDRTWKPSGDANRDDVFNLLDIVLF